MPMTLKIVFLLFICLIWTDGSAQELKQKKFLYSIPEVKQGIDKTFYSIEAYVMKIYECPECPTPETCKPCQSNHIYVSRTKELYDSQNSLSYLLLRTNAAQIFEVGKEYIFLIQVVGHGGKDSTPEYRLITDYKEIPENVRRK